MQNYYVYILYSVAFDKTYVGYSSDIEGRLSAHNHPKNKGFTKRFQPWIIVYDEAFQTKAEAMSKEKFFKTGKGRELISNILKEAGYRS